ncbi:MAG TPA: YCF48-related protein, partial [Planctomycetota bacterium]|nr:YCF48-related protein [Planctomycetota bacterium]
CNPAGPATLYGIVALGSSGALAVGYGSGTFLAPSSNACFADNTPPALVSPPLFAASAPSALEAWAVGMFNAIRHSGDGGLSWQNLAGPTTFRLADGHFLDGTTGWIAGQGYGIAKTTDGGTTFQMQSSQATGSFALGISFGDAQHGCSVGQAGFVRYTTDGGQSWPAPASVPTAVDLADVTFVTATTVVAVGADGTVLRSLNGGANWTAAILAGAPDLEAVAFSGPQNGLVVGAGGVAIRYASGAWILTPTGTMANLHGVSLASPSAGYAVGDGGIVLFFNGTGFAPAYASPTGLPLHAVEALPSGEAFAAGDEGLFARFDGSAWSEPKSRTSIPLRALSFTTPASGWAVGITNLVMRYEAE